MFHTNIQTAVIPVAGLGTRMLPATKAIPKELLPVYDRPIIEHVVREAIASGIKKIVLVTRSGKEAIENHFDAHYELEHRLENKGKQTILGKVKDIIPSEVDIISIRQSDALGLGHAILCSRPVVDDRPFVVLLPDMMILDKPERGLNYSLKSLVNAFKKTGVGQILVERIDKKLADRYGIVDLNNSISEPFKTLPIKGIEEKPLPEFARSNLAIVGRYVLAPKVFDYLNDVSPGVGGEIQLTDALMRFIDTQELNSVETDADIFDCGNVNGFIGANLVMGLRNQNTAKSVVKLLKKYS